MKEFKLLVHERFQAKLVLKRIRNVKRLNEMNKMNIMHKCHHIQSNAKIFSRGF